MTINQQYGRRWKLELTTTANSIVIEQKDMKTDSLRITFSVDYARYQAFYMADITIWNLKAETLNMILVGQVEGTEVELSAGYMDGKFGKIFKGQVFQCIFTREDAKDYKLKLRCVDGYKVFVGSFTSFSVTKEYNYQTVLNAIAAYSSERIPVGTVSQNMKVKPMPRGVSAFGPTKIALGKLVADNNATYRVIDNKLEIMKLEDNLDPMLTYISPKSGLIGTPEQYDYGVKFKCLLNPDLALKNPPKGVVFTDTMINVSSMSGPSTTGALPPLLATGPDSEANKWLEGLFQIAGVKHYGDTRGNDWYSEVYGLTMAGAVDVRFAQGATVPAAYQRGDKP